MSGYSGAGQWGQTLREQGFSYVDQKFGQTIELNSLVKPVLVRCSDETSNDLSRLRHCE
jgi:hypothetical protein